MIGYAPSPIRYSSSIKQVAKVCLAYDSSIWHFLVLFLLAVIGRTQVRATMLGTSALIAVYILGGFLISKG
jgi:hypothetical protein